MIRDKDEQTCSELNAEMWTRTLETRYRLPQPILGADWHMVNAKSGLDLGIADDVVFGEFLHPEMVERGEVKCLFIFSLIPAFRLKVFFHHISTS